MRSLTDLASMREILPSGSRPRLSDLALALPQSHCHIRGMKASFSLPATALLAVVLIASSALAQVKPMVGQTVRAVDGVVLGQVTQVVADAAGHPTQVLVQPKGVRTLAPHSLSVKSLTDTPEGLKAPITKAEFDAMPVVDLEN